MNKGKGDHLSEALRRLRALQITEAENDLARHEFYRAVHRLYCESDLSFAQLAPIFGVTRSRIQQIVAAGAGVCEPES